MHYFKKYLKVAPLSLAIWRSLEAHAVSKHKIETPILDLGCGFGEFVGVFFDSTVEVGVDISRNDLILASKNKKYQKLLMADARNLPFKNSLFKTVLSISTLEHIKDVQKVFSESFRVLKPGGFFIFTVPTIELNEILLVSHILKKIKFRFLASIYLKLFHWVFKHEVIILKEEWVSMTKKTGFQIKYCKGTSSKKQIRIFELFLPSAFPSQLTRFFFGKRLFFSLTFRVRVLNNLFKRFLKEREVNDANIIIIAQKPQ